MALRGSHVSMTSNKQGSNPVLYFQLRNSGFLEQLYLPRQENPIQPSTFFYEHTKYQNDVWLFHTHHQFRLTYPSSPLSFISLLPCLLNPFHPMYSSFLFHIEYTLLYSPVLKKISSQIMGLSLLLYASHILILAQMYI